MNRTFTFFLLFNISINSIGQIIADHTVVDQFDNIPQQYLDEVKKMWLVVAGESHSAAYRTGFTLLESSNPLYSVSVVESGTPEGYTTSNLRASRGTWGDYSNATGWIYSYGEEDWWTNVTAVNRTKAGISYCNANNLTIGAMGFGWCADMTLGTATTGVDPVFGVHWYGWSIAGPDGDKAWGLDGADYSITGNSVNLETYLSVTQQYIDYCTLNNIPTKVFFTTGPVDEASSQFTGERGYQAHLKHEYIRNYVKSDPSRILFDYADILCYDNDGTPSTQTWDGHTYPQGTEANILPEQVGHISNAGALRLGKAMWWMLARISGWNGITTDVKNNNIDEVIKVIVDYNSKEIRIQTTDVYLSGQINIYNMQGLLIENQSVNNDLCIINTSSLSTGMYFVNVKKGNLLESRKIVILK